MKGTTFVHIVSLLIVIVVALSIFSIVSYEPYSDNNLIFHDLPSYDNFTLLIFLVGIILSAIGGYLFAVSFGCIINPFGILFGFALLFLAFKITNFGIFLVFFIVMIITMIYTYDPYQGRA